MFKCRCVLPIFLFLHQLLALDMDNTLLGNPEIKCNTDTIEMQFRTKRIFTGKVYVKGHYNNPDCRVDYSQTNTDGIPTGGIRLHHGSCDMDRQRTIRPEGMLFSTVLVISFHPLFVTKTDRAFSINCMYREALQTVESKMDVSPLATESIQNDMPMPECTYTIRKDEIDGPILQYAKVGDQIVHRWECKSDIYGLLVHSCYVEDGQGEKALVIDEHGCHTDRILLGDPTYVQALNMAYRESNVFKFADRVAVRFQCAIRLCLKVDGGCNEITPPNCQANSSDFGLRSRRSVVPTRSKNVNLSAPRIDVDLFSQRVTVLDSDLNSQKLLPLGLQSDADLRLHRICLSPPFFTIVIAATSLLLIVTISLVFHIYYRNYRALHSAESAKSSGPLYSPNSLVLT
ncbi:hypothetical protein L596_014992 [Steinernema carpocapsae]|uniref:ZP domain-containing protein n=1 Tax=Steinernema carpocapsae TaxID=34508 RepID=A0A4U5NEW3_STECR|nr:hypothetical protein L596_014992 [Steinernema carpocapsae]